MPHKQGTSRALETVEGMGIRSISQEVLYSNFVDGGSTAGTMTLRKKLPAYCFPIGTKIEVTTGFTGNSSAVLTVGTSTTTLVAGVVDADILTMGTNKSVYTAGKTYMQYALFSDAATVQDDDQTVASNYILLTVTSGTDFTLVTAGKMTVTVYYLSTVPE